MSAESLLTSMEKLLKLHKSLYDLAVKKTDIVKRGDMDALNQVLKDEQSHIAAITKFEKERSQAAKNIVPNIEKPTVSDCIEHVSAEKQSELLDISSNLSEIAFKLKEQNYLNQQLVYQSLQFVNLSLNMLSPQEEQFNYTEPARNKQQDSKSIFDLKA